MQKVAVLGAGSWGTALAVLLARKGYSVKLYGRHRAAVDKLTAERENIKYLPGVKLPDGLLPTADIAASLRGAKLVVMAVPSHAVRALAKEISPYLDDKAILVNTAKGIEQETYLRLSQVVKEELPNHKFVVLSGPSHAEEVGKDLPTVVVAASDDLVAAEQVQDFFMSPNFRVYTNPDVTGVELGGALKNVIALCTGIADGLGFGDNTKAALMTRGLAEIGRLGLALGAQPLTFAGLTGVGDLIVTCTSLHSRNLRAGILLGKGKPLEQVLQEVGMVVEGVRTAKGAYHLAQQYGVEMPIVQQAYAVLFENKDPYQGVKDLMGRGRTHEIHESEEVVNMRTQWNK
jgi:glycerol-3-phosphate dehydrogenase (NAD(P)+)